MKMPLYDSFLKVIQNFEYFCFLGPHLVVLQDGIQALCSINFPGTQRAIVVGIYLGI